MMNAVSFTLAPWAAFSRQLVAQWCRTGSQVRDRRLWRGSVGYSQVKDGLEVRAWLSFFFSFFSIFLFLFFLFTFFVYISFVATLYPQPTGPCIFSQHTYSNQTRRVRGNLYKVERELGDKVTVSKISYNVRFTNHCLWIHQSSIGLNPMDIGHCEGNLGRELTEQLRKKFTSYSYAWIPTSETADASFYPGLFLSRVFEGCD